MDQNYSIDEDFQEFNEALEDLLDVTDQMAEDADKHGDDEALEDIYNTRKAIKDLQNSYGDIEDEIRLSREWIDEVRQAEEYFFPRYLDTIDATLQNIEHASERLGNPMVYRERGRRGFLGLLALAVGGFGIVFAANELSDEYDVDLNYTGLGNSEEEPRRAEGEAPQDTPDTSDPLEKPLDSSDYEFVVTDEDLIGDIGSNYENYSSELGDLGLEILEEYNDTSYQRLTLGYDDDTRHVQLKDLGDNLMVNFGFEDSKLYEDAKRMAREVNH